MASDSFGRTLLKHFSGKLTSECLREHMLPCMSPVAQLSSNLLGFNPFLEKMPVNEGSQLQDCEIELN